MVNHCLKKEKINFSSSRPPLCMVSACLVGLCTRYDGRLKPSAACRAYLEDHLWIPFCPEQLGGLPTPRTAADLMGGDGFEVLAGRARVVDKTGRDVTPQFLRGAEQSLIIARAQETAEILLKSGSPSCGLGPIIGVTAALLVESGFPVKEF